MKPIIRVPLGTGPGGGFIYDLNDLPPNTELQPFCPGDAIPVEGLGCDGATRVEYTIVERPPGANANLTSNNTPNTTFSGPTPGSYGLRLCCFEDDGPVNPAPVTGPFLDMPYGHPAGETLKVCIFECEDAIDIQFFIAGPISQFTQDGNCVLINTTNTVGTVQLIAICTFEDGTTSNASAQTILFDPTLELVAEDTEPACIKFRECLERCYCDTVFITIDACDTACTTDTVAIIANKPCDADPIEPPELPELSLMPIIGRYPASTPIVFKENMISGCFEEIKCPLNKHEPHFIWNDCGLCPDWEVEGDAAAAANCDPNDPWCITGGSGTYAAGGSTVCAVDIAVILDHNFDDVQITTDPPPFGGPSVLAGPVYDAAKVNGYVRPVVIPLDGITDATNVQMDITGTALGGGDIKVGRVIFGRKLFLPENGLRVWGNPHNAAACVPEVKFSACGLPLSQTMRRSEIPWAVIVSCMDEEYMCETWRPFMRYLCETGAEVLFQWSRNNKPEDLLVARLNGVQPVPRYTSPCLQESTLSLIGYNQMQQPKLYA